MRTVCDDLILYEREDAHRWDREFETHAMEQRRQRKRKPILCRVPNWRQQRQRARKGNRASILAQTVKKFVAVD